MKARSPAEIALSLGVLALGLGVAAGTALLPSEGGYAGVGPNFVPGVAGAGLILLGVWLAYEALAGYGSLTHGEAVAIGMVHASRLAERRGLIGPDVTARQVALLRAIGLPTELPEGMSFPPADILSRMRLDKKNTAGRLRFILPTRLGEVKLFDDVP